MHAIESASVYDLTCSVFPACAKCFYCSQGRVHTSTSLRTIFKSKRKPQTKALPNNNLLTTNMFVFVCFIFMFVSCPDKLNWQFLNIFYNSLWITPIGQAFHHLNHLNSFHEYHYLTQLNQTAWSDRTVGIETGTFTFNSRSASAENWPHIPRRKDVAPSNFQDESKAHASIVWIVCRFN